MIEFKVRQDRAAYFGLAKSCFSEDTVGDRFSAPRAAARIAVVVMDSTSGPALCPFFNKCDGVVVLNKHDGVLVLEARYGSREFHPNIDKTSEATCDLILALLPDWVVCGFIGTVEKRRLRAAGIDVRLGSCACAIEELAAGCCDLPEA